MAQQDLKLPVRDSVDIAAVIAGELFAVIGIGGVGPGHRHTAGQPDIRSGGADEDLIPAALDLKLVGFDVEVAKCFVIQGNGDSFAFASLQKDLCKAL